MERESWWGRIRRHRRKVDAEGWEEVKALTGMNSAPADQAPPDRVPAWWRGHWRIESQAVRVRDGRDEEDRRHGRKIGFGLSGLRNGALNIIRHPGYRYVPDGWRALGEHPEPIGLILTMPWLEF